MCLKFIMTPSDFTSLSSLAGTCSVFSLRGLTTVVLKRDKKSVLKKKLCQSLNVEDKVNYTDFVCTRV